MIRIVTATALAVLTAGAPALAQQRPQFPDPTRIPANQGQGGNNNQNPQERGRNTQGGINNPTNQGRGNQAAAGAASGIDAAFVEAAAMAGLAEVTVSEIGAQKAGNDELKQFSQQMITDHQQVNQQLMNHAARRQVAMPRTLDAGTRFSIMSLRNESGEEFDRCYARTQLVAHLKSVALFEAEAKHGQDPELKALAEKTLPRIKEHLAAIKPIAMKYEHDSAGHGSGDRESTHKEASRPGERQDPQGARRNDK